jgi:hypothetical protein
MTTRKNYSSFAGNLPEHLLSDFQISDLDDMDLSISDSSIDPRKSLKLDRASQSRLAQAAQQTMQARLDRAMTRSRSLKSSDMVDPLSLLQSNELEAISSKEKSVSTHLDDKKYLESRLPVIQFEELKLISIKIAPSSAYNSVAPSALACSANLILVGNTNGHITVFSHQGHEILLLKPKKSCGQVTCIDISFDDNFAIVGYHFGHLVLWNLTNGKAIKTSNAVHKTAVLAVRFWKEGKDEAISADKDGRLCLLGFSKALMSTNLHFQDVLREPIGAILAVEPLKPEPRWPHPTDTDRIVAVAGMGKVVVLALEPEIRTIFTIDRPIGISPHMCPCISWKLAMSPEDQSPLHHILAVAWGQRIILYTLKFASAEGVLISGYLETDTEIKSIFWLSYEIILCLNRSREIQVITSREFSTKPGESGRRAVLEETYANKDLALQIYVKIDQKENFTYHNTLKAIDRVVFLLGNKEFHKGQLLNWKECLDELMKKNDWLEVLALGLNLYQGRGKKLYGVPRNKDELRTHLVEFLNPIIRMQLIPWNVRIPAILEFCAGIEAVEHFFDVLFDKIFESINNQGDMKVLMSTLELYVLTGKIKVMPPVVLGKVIGYYLGDKHHTTIERIIVHLDPICIDPKCVIPACDEHNLLLAYIYVNTNSTLQSFVNPLKKIYKTMTKQNDLRAKLYFTYKLLWYYRLCLKGETFPNGKVLPEMRKIMIIGIVKWLLKRKHFFTLMQNDSFITLMVVWEIFKETLPKEVLTDPSCTSPTYMDLIMKLKEICAPGTFLYHQFFLFTLKTATLDYVSLEKSICVEVARYFLSQSRPSQIISIFATSIDDYINFYCNLQDKNQVFTEFTTEEKSQLLLSMLKKHQMSQKEIEEISFLASKTSFIELIIYLLELAKDYSGCVRNFVQCEVEETRKKVFPWLNEIFAVISSNEYEKNKLKDCLMTNLNKLVEIDSDLTAKLVTDWFQNQHLDIVRKLNNAPKLQMKYLGELVNLQDQIEEDLIFKYLILLCQHEPSKVINFLESRNDYNLDECLNECIKYQVIEAAAYLHEKLGSVKDALDLLLGRAQSNKNEFLNGGKSFEVIPEIEKDIKQCILLCNRNVDRLDMNEIEEYFFAVLEVILQLFSEFGHMFKVNPTIENSVHVCIRDILEMMINIIDFNKIITFIVKKVEKMPFKHIKENIYQVLSQHSYQKSIVKRAINLLTSDVKAMTRNLFSSKSKGINSNGHCKTCSNVLQCDKKDRVVVFICGHAYHRKCVKGGRCGFCSAGSNKVF